MIGPTGTVRVMVATRPVDFRKGAEGLSVLVREVMAADSFSGTIYITCSAPSARTGSSWCSGTAAACVLCLFASGSRTGSSAGRRSRMA
jgi:transposase